MTSTAIIKAMKEIKSITNKYSAGPLKEISLLDWLTEIILQEVYNPPLCLPAAYEAKDAKVLYLPELRSFSILVYITKYENAKELFLPLSLALEETIGITELEEAKACIKFMKSDCCQIAKTMQTKINDALYINTNSWRMFDI